LKIIEDALQTHPAVLLTAAVGSPDAYAGELPVAYVQLKPGTAVTEAELLEHAARTIPEKAAIPKRIKISSSLPTTAVGKLFKPALVERRQELSMSDKPISPLRQRMIDDMTARRFSEDTQRDYVRNVRNFAAFLGRSPDTATKEDLMRGLANVRAEFSLTALAYNLRRALNILGVEAMTAAVAA
jgi:hypothetical protein